VFVQDDQLWLNGTKALVPLAGESYRVAVDPSGCARVEFEARLNSCPQQLLFLGIASERASPDIVGAFGRPA
jgi:hypothetical protein